jgi:hypothetical protein
MCPSGAICLPADMNFISSNVPCSRHGIPVHLVSNNNHSLIHRVENSAQISIDSVSRQKWEFWYKLYNLRLPSQHQSDYGFHVSDPRYHEMKIGIERL